jgi:hypothetical protein
MMLLNRREDIVTTAITTIVVMVVAIMSPAHARGQPLLRLLDTSLPKADENPVLQYRSYTSILLE